MEAEREEAQKLLSELTKEIQFEKAAAVADNVNALEMQEEADEIPNLIHKLIK